MRRLCIAGLALCLPVTASLADEAFVDFRSLKPEYALRMAEAAMEHCRDQGYQVGVTVVDKSGVPQVFVRDRYAGTHVYETSYRKAWTATSFRTNTTDLAVTTQSGEPASAIRHLSLALPLGGGMMVTDGEGALVAAIGVSGAPGGDADDVCAQAGIDAIADDIAF